MESQQHKKQLIIHKQQEAINNNSIRWLLEKKSEKPLGSSMRRNRQIFEEK